MLFILLLGLIVFLLGGLALALQSSVLFGRGFDVLAKRFPRVLDFCYGALFGFFAGFMPAAIVYAVTASQAAAFVIGVLAMIACGIAWSWFSSRSTTTKATKSTLPTRPVRNGPK